MTGPSARHVAEIVRKERRQLLRDPRTRMIMFAAPILQLLMFGYAVNTDIRDTATFVVDRDASVASRRLVEAFTTTDRFEVAGASSRSADIPAALDRGAAVVAIEIPAEFAADLAAARPARVQVIVDGTHSNTATVALGYAARVVRTFGRENGPWTGVEPRGIDLRSRAWYNPGLESRVYNVPAVIGILLFLMCLLLTALAVAREREIGTLEQLMVTPLTPTELMLGKTIPVAVVGMIDLVLVTLVAVLWFGVPLRGSPVALLLAALIYILAGLAFGLLISTVSRTQQEAFMTMFLFVLPAVILGGFLFPVETMPGPFRWISMLDPVRHFLYVVRAIFLKGEGIAGLWPQYVVLLAMAIGALAFSVFRFRKTVA
ncbi:MAG TPA: ABC transporter permease [Gemmatimonadota bacterium]|nr:ABC transporter permease [Gemmatimonadota bacterium]